MSKDTYFYLDENNQIQEAEIMEKPPKFFWRIEHEYERQKALREAHNQRLDNEKAERIARQNQEDYTPEPTHPDLPLNQNRVSSFEYHYGEIAFFGTAFLILIIIGAIIYITSTPM